MWFKGPGKWKFCVCFRADCVTGRHSKKKKTKKKKEKKTRISPIWTIIWQNESSWYSASFGTIRPSEKCRKNSEKSSEKIFVRPTGRKISVRPFKIFPSVRRASDGRPMAVGPSDGRPTIFFSLLCRFCIYFHGFIWTKPMSQHLRLHLFCHTIHRHHASMVLWF